MNDLLINKSLYPEFEFIIDNYFKFHKDNILNVINKWKNDMVNNLLINKMNISINKFIELVK
jgi:hypothetical protein